MSPTIDDETTWKAAYLSLLDSWTALCDLASVEGDSAPAEVLASVRLRRAGYLLVSEAELATALARYDCAENGDRHHTSKFAALIFAALVAAQEKGEAGS